MICCGAFPGRRRGSALMTGRLKAHGERQMSGHFHSHFGACLGLLVIRGQKHSQTIMQEMKTVQRLLAVSGVRRSAWIAGTTFHVRVIIFHTSAKGLPRQCGQCVVRVLEALHHFLGAFLLVTAHAIMVSQVPTASRACLALPAHTKTQRALRPAPLVPSANTLIL